MEEEIVDNRLNCNVGYGNGHGPTGITILQERTFVKALHGLPVQKKQHKGALC